MNIFGHITWDPRRAEDEHLAKRAEHLHELEELLARDQATDRQAISMLAPKCPVIPIERLRQARDARLRREARGIGRRPIGGDAA